MSFESWKKEFFVNDLKKWEGLKSESLLKHFLEKGSKFLNPIGTVDVSGHPNQYSKIFSERVCSLCYKYHNEKGNWCDDCPIMIKNCSTCRPQWDEWVDNGNAQPMIDLLKSIPEASINYKEIHGFLDQANL